MDDPYHSHDETTKMAAVGRERAEFSITYEGPALQDGRMDVRELAPASLALGELLQEANAITYPAAPNVTLAIRAFERALFDVTLQSGAGSSAGRGCDYPVFQSTNSRRAQQDRGGGPAADRHPQAKSA
jgi:hypothetical protein